MYIYLTPLTDIIYHERKIFCRREEEIYIKLFDKKKAYVYLKIWKDNMNRNQTIKQEPYHMHHWYGSPFALLSMVSYEIEPAS